MQVRKLTPKHMRPGGGQRRAMHVTCAMFSSTSGEIVATYNDEVLPTSRAALPQALIHERNGITEILKRNIGICLHTVSSWQIFQICCISRRNAGVTYEMGLDPAKAAYITVSLRQKRARLHKHSYCLFGVIVRRPIVGLAAGPDHCRDTPSRSSILWMGWKHGHGAMCGTQDIYLFAPERRSAVGGRADAAGRRRAAPAALLRSARCKRPHPSDAPPGSAAAAGSSGAGSAPNPKAAAEGGAAAVGATAGAAAEGSAAAPPPEAPSEPRLYGSGAGAGARGSLAAPAARKRRLAAERRRAFGSDGEGPPADLPAEPGFPRPLFPVLHSLLLSSCVCSHLWHSGCCPKLLSAPRSCC